MEFSTIPLNRLLRYSSPKHKRHPTALLMGCMNKTPTLRPQAGHANQCRMPANLVCDVLKPIGVLKMVSSEAIRVSLSLFFARERYSRIAILRHSSTKNFFPKSCGFIGFAIRLRHVDLLVLGYKRRIRLDVHLNHRRLELLERH